MTEQDVDAWKEEYSGRERVRMVVELLDEPATISDIADKADVAWGTADSELKHLLTEKKVQEDTVDGNTKYGLNPVQMLVEEVLNLISENTREELESALVDYKSQVESLQGRYGVETLSELRNHLIDEDLSAEEMREVRDGASTWGALETEIRLTKHALELYDDVTRLSDSDGDRLAIA